MGKGWVRRWRWNFGVYIWGGMIWDGDTHKDVAPGGLIYLRFTAHRHIPSYPPCILEDRMPSATHFTSSLLLCLILGLWYLAFNANLSLATTSAPPHVIQKGYQ
jgi:hypothetical protein